EDLIRRFGSVVPAYNINLAAQALKKEIDSQSSAKIEKRKAMVDAEFRWEDYAFSLLSELNADWRKISVVFRNYNYLRYLEELLESIFQQTVPVYEVIVLDDASTDDSLDAVERVARRHRRSIRVIENPTNSGSVMKQWTRAAREASGELIWIAEADDLSEAT